jgi:hypothetical protein
MKRTSANPKIALFLLNVFLGLSAAAQAPLESFGEPVPGYRGIWYSNEKTNNEYVYKYSGGLGTYCANHIPMAVYAPEVNKTFFVYGGTSETGDSLWEMVSYYDHATGEVPQPVRIIDKETTDAHDNPVLSIDPQGYLLVFASAHGSGRPAYIFRSLKPYDIARFEKVADFNYSYPQPWHIEGQGFFFLHTWYKDGRGLYFRTSPDGRTWSERIEMAHIEEGHYQVSWPWQGRVGSCFNYHPAGKGLNFRTNLYYMHTADMGKTWSAADGTPVPIPVKDIVNPALVRDYAAEGRLVYTMDLNYDAEGRPHLLYMTAKSWISGPEGGPRFWTLARWTGKSWTFHEITEADSNYDFGSIYIGEGGLIRVVGPTETGPQAYNPGGEMAIWRSEDYGETWKKDIQLTSGSGMNHTYARRPLGAREDFLALWADGDGREPSTSRLYFLDGTKGQVRQLPFEMVNARAVPVVVDVVK